MNIPSQNLLTPLKPQISAQKPPHGIQHPGGDALQPMASCLASGESGMQIYMQDYFANTFSGEIYLPMEIDVQLKAGDSTIRFSNNRTSPTTNIESGWAPNIASIQVAAAEQ